MTANVLRVALCAGVLFACARVETAPKAQAEVLARRYISENCPKFDLSRAKINGGESGTEIDLTFVDKDIDKIFEEYARRGQYLLDLDIAFLFSKNPLRITMVRGCRKYR
ncbi:MAG: hypothetical protein JF625_07190 [Inquilinus limosus]|uniref:Lipoprotein n=1 Tax=Inquilinus limosus TaxID=171674 RepID=A0A952FMG9_9PROT|nr:hypothetical protein [Inquilinus limosus]